jgi:predicted nucleotide-binding protein
MNQQLVYSAFGSDTSFLSLPQEALAQRLLAVLKGWDLRSFNPRNTVSGILQFYTPDQDAITEAIYSAWGFLTREGYLVPDHDAVQGEWWKISSKGKATTKIDQRPQAEAEPQLPGVPEATPEERRRTVMVVYGRDARLKDAIFVFLRSLGLHPIEWETAVRSTGDATPYNRQVISAAFSAAQAVVVILSGDDEGRLLERFRQTTDEAHERNLTPQARLNVIFEAGMAFGSRASQTVLVEVGKLRPFSDIAGMNVVRFDGSDLKRRAFMNRLETAGCKLDTSGDRYLKLVLDYDFLKARSHEGVATELASDVLSVAQPQASTDSKVHELLIVFEKELRSNGQMIREKTRLGNSVGPYFTAAEYVPSMYQHYSTARWDAFQGTPALAGLDTNTIALLADAYGRTQVLIKLEDEYRRIQHSDQNAATQVGYELRNHAGPALAAIEAALEGVSVPN